MTTDTSKQENKNLTRYNLKKFTDEDKEASKKIIKNNVNPVIADLFVLRGAKDFDDVNLAQKVEPFLNMKGIKEASILLENAINENKKICIVADYDVDGATACAIAVRGLKMFGANVDYFVPNRFKHGYGLKPTVVDEAIEYKNPDIIVTVDNGIASHEGVDYAHEKGIVVLVTDHHLAGDTIPNADCIVNPNQPGCNFKNKSLAGCGVMFYVLAGLRQHLIDKGVYTEKTAPAIFSLLDLVAIGTVADLVKLEKNNRILVNFGLNLIKKGKTKVGVLALCSVAGIGPESIGTVDIGFKIGPRLNAAGRLEDMSLGINCLITDNADIAFDLANQLNDINKKRRSIESEMKEQALELPSLQEGKYSKVAYDDSFHEGVIGIVASRIKELFYRPTIVFAPAHDDIHIKGSGRSIGEVHLRDALDYVHKKSPEVLSIFGGHAMAAGLTIKKEHLEQFKTLFEEAVAHFTEGKELINQKEIDLHLKTEFINIETAQLIKDEIWGMGFAQPLFMGSFNIIEQRILKNAHLKLKVEKDGMFYDAIWFSKNQLLEEEQVQLIYTLDINEYNGNIKVQLLVEGIYEQS